MTPHCICNPHAEPNAERMPGCPVHRLPMTPEQKVALMEKVLREIASTEPRIARTVDGRMDLVKIGQVYSLRDKARAALTKMSANTHKSPTPEELRDWPECAK